MPVAYPTTCGPITRSLGGDCDPLDALVYTHEPNTPDTIVKVRAIGVLKMIDGGETVAAPASDIDPTYDDIKEISHLPKIERERF